MQSKIFFHLCYIINMSDIIEMFIRSTGSNKYWITVFLFYFIAMYHELPDSKLKLAQRWLMAGQLAAVCCLLFAVCRTTLNQHRTNIVFITVGVLTSFQYLTNVVHLINVGTWTLYQRWSNIKLVLVGANTLYRCRTDGLKYILHEL